MIENIQPQEDAVELFSLFPEKAPASKSRARSVSVSMGLHAAIFLAVLVAPLFYPGESPPAVDYIRALIYNPPPPPPPPLPKGASNKPVEKAPEKTGAKPPDPDVLVEPPIPEDPKPVEPEKGIDPLKQFGVENGSEAGSVDGMEAGVVGGTVGGTLGGTLGGVIGGTGDNPVMDYDQPPRLLKQTRPVYPQEAFIKKIEGVVTLEILIGVDGRVGRARVLRSIPQLDAAAIQTVRQWVFSPAIKGGRPVPTTAQAPVSFRIY
ncbi:MAG: energy transducer TonB [Vicinamibacteria bacterium]|nr:energy transducer TonB [Vicinamibacteria bacterium]